MKLFKACGNSNSCVYVGAEPTNHGSIVVADRSNPEPGNYLSFTPEEWREFVAAAKAGYFDLDEIDKRDRLTKSESC